jgi:hypothetical protein
VLKIKMAAIREKIQIKFTRMHQRAENQDGSHQHLYGEKIQLQFTRVPHVLKIKIAAISIC